MPRGKYVIPGGIDAHTHMELPFGGTAASDTFETGTRAAAWGGTTTIIDFAVQRTGEVVQDGLAAWHAKAEGNCHVDYAFHMILGGVDDDALKAMDQLVTDEGITSFKLFMAYPGVFYSDDGQILRAMQTARENGAMIMMHAENGIAIDVLVQQALARGETDPIYHGITRPAALETEATSRAITLAEVARGLPALHRAPVGERSPRSRRGGARRRPERVRRDLPAVPVPDAGGPAGRARLRRRQVGLLDALAQQARAAREGPVERAPEQRSGDRVDRPLPVLHEGPEGAGPSATSPRSRTGSAESSTASTCSTKASSTGSCRWSAGSRRSRRRRPGCSGCTRARASSRPGSDADMVVYDPNGHDPDRRRDASHEHGLLGVRRDRDRRAGSAR